MQEEVLYHFWEDLKQMDHVEWLLDLWLRHMTTRIPVPWPMSSRETLVRQVPIISIKVIFEDFSAIFEYQVRP